MSKPATDWFCENGHHVGSAGHGEYGEYDISKPQPPCTYCGSSCFRLITEWNDCDYWEDGDIDQVVNHTPVDLIDVPKKDHFGNDYFVQVEVYDVSKLFVKK